MKITASTTERIKNVSYVVEGVPNLGTVIYTDSYNENDRIVDSYIRTEEGYAIESPALFENIQDFIGSNSVEVSH